jgi:8-oxo-dGTP pyrophosphatase MutT (NUDIX family)
MLAPQPAATVMIARQNGEVPEFFMLRRNSRSAFMPDVFVFPGGRVEAGDTTAEACAQLDGAAAGIEPAWLYAAVRETFEECGLLFTDAVVAADALAAGRADVLAGTRRFAQVLADLGARIDASALRYFSRWITPPLESRRFDTHFFVARAPAGQIAQADARETHDGIWITPREALAQHAAGAFALIFPTIKHLERIAGFASIDALLAFAASKSVYAVMPHADGERGFAIPAAIEGLW